MATPVRVLERSGDQRSDHRAIAALIAEYEAGELVVGLPVSLDGSHGPAAQAVLAECGALADEVEVPLHTHDERLTTVSAERILADQQLDARARRKVVDMVAAAIILQGWLDRQVELRARQSP